jgi:hypothetical protein
MGKGASNTMQQAQSQELAGSGSLIALAQQQAGNASTLFNQSLPGFSQAQSFYRDLASGDPYALMRAISPATQQITAASTGAKQNILSNAPAGGEKNLALEQVDVNQGAQVGKTASEAFLNAPNALAQLAQQGIGESQNATGLALSGTSSGIQGFGQVGQEAVQQKGATLGAFGSLGGDVATLGSGWLGGKAEAKG